MLDEILNSINNYFDTDKYGEYWGRHEGSWSIDNSSIELDFLAEGQYFRVEGSLFNDGVHKYGDDLPEDEEFDGVIYELRIPPAFIDLATKIGDWQTKYGDVAASPYNSESFAGYSYSKGNSSSNGNVASSWQSAFKSQLRVWRKI